MIETERLVLRPPTEADLPWIEEAINTAAVMRNLGGVRTAEQVAQSLADDIAAFASGGHRRWTVMLRGDERRIGRCGLFPLRSAAAPVHLRGQMEIGWTFAESDWGHGYATEAANAVLGFAFAALDLDCVYGQTSDSNAASTRMMGRLGFARCPADDYVDPDYPALDNPTTVFRLTRADWAHAQ